MRKNVLTMALLSYALSGGAGAFAHGPQIQITNDQNKITTRQLFQDGPYNNYPGAASAPASVYVIPLAPQAAFNGIGYWSQPNPAYPVSGSGLAWTQGWSYDTSAHTTFPAGSRFVEWLSGDLKTWNGSSFTFNALDPNRPQLELLKGSTAVVSGPVDVSSGTSLPALVAPTSAADTTHLDDHTSIKFQLLGDGVIPSASHNTAPVADGIYLAKLKLSLANQPSGSNIADSDPFYFVLWKGTGESAALSAAQSAFPGASIQLVPEPAGAGMLAAAAMVMLRRRRV